MDYPRMEGETEPMMPDPIVCPACESGELRPGPILVRCSVCDYVLSRDLFSTLRQIRALPEAEPAWRPRKAVRNEGDRNGET